MSEINNVAGEGDPTGPLGVYVHVPFCSSTCDFCAFYQTAPTDGAIRRYLGGISDEASTVAWRGRRAGTVFWGGGTPGLLSPKAIRALGGIIAPLCGGRAKEWTVEMAPASVTEARLAALKEIGVTRISMGAQSFQPALLDGLGRQHTREQIYKAYDRIRAAGFSSVNIDMMFALPGQDEKAWLADLEEALALAPDHLSTYCLTFEEDTKLWVKLSKGQVKLDVEHEARLYEVTWARLEAAGYAQYEISNFARGRHVCLHNLNTWRMHEWVGLGPSAASQHDGWRGGNIANLEQWHAGLARGMRMTEDRVALTPTLLAEDALIFGVRMNAGVDMRALQTRFPAAPWAAVEAESERLVDAGVAVREGGVLKLTPRGRLIADTVGAELMQAFAAAQVA